MAPEPPMKSGFFPRFGSKFRYSGKTFFETKNATIDRVQPRFERSLSGRNIASSRSVDGIIYTCISIFLKSLVQHLSGNSYNI